MATAINARCPVCRNLQRIERDLLDRQFPCRSCGRPLRAQRKVLARLAAATTDFQSLATPRPPSRAVFDAEPIAQREHCLECGRDISEQERVLTCRHCASLFCSSACCRRHDDFAHAGKQLGQSTGDKPASSRADNLGRISVICGAIGLIVFGIPLGLVALACGIPAAAMGSKQGIRGIVLGILDIVLAIVVLALIFSH